MQVSSLMCSWICLFMFDLDCINFNLKSLPLILICHWNDLYKSWSFSIRNAWPTQNVLHQRLMFDIYLINTDNNFSIRNVIWFWVLFVKIMNTFNLHTYTCTVYTHKKSLVGDVLEWAIWYNWKGKCYNDVDVPHDSFVTVKHYLGMLVNPSVLQNALRHLGVSERGFPAGNYLG